MTGFVANTSKIGHLWVTKYNKCVSANIRFQSASNNLVGLLTVGAVIGTGVTIGNYLIEWRLGSITGPIQLYSGVGPDPLIQATHPFVSEPVEGGTLYAVIRYIFVDGVRYSPNQIEGQYSPDLKTCLGTINVVTMNCSNGGASTYSHTVSYNNTTDPSQNAARTLRFDLNSDGSTAWFAYQFTGYTVADKIKVDYIHADDVNNPITISEWIVGSNATTNFNSNPKVYGTGQTTLKQLLDLTTITYETGDYLLIYITPRVLEPGQNNTNWQLNLKCLTAAQFICPSFIPEERTMDTSTVTASWNATSCMWQFKWYNLATPGVAKLGHLYTYLPLTNYTGANSNYTYQTGECTINLVKKTQVTSAYINYSGTCLQLAGSMNAVKTGANMTLTFTHTADYDLYKNRYTNLSTQPNWTNYDADPTVNNHYKFLTVFIRQSVNCGDAYTDRNVLMHRNSPITFDDANRVISYTITNVTNQLPVIECNDSVSAANTLINSTNTSINMADFNITTYVSFTYAITGIYLNSVILDQTESPSTNFYAPCSPHYKMLEAGCVPGGWYSGAGIIPQPDYIGFPVFYCRAYITNTADPINNFRITTFMDFATGAKLTVGVIVYEKANGVQIIP